MFDFTLFILVIAVIAVFVILLAVSGLFTKIGNLVKKIFKPFDENMSDKDKK